MPGYIEVPEIRTAHLSEATFRDRVRRTVGAFHAEADRPPFDLWDVVIHSPAPSLRIIGAIVGLEAKANGWTYRFLSFDRHGDPAVQALPASMLKRWTAEDGVPA